MLARTRLIKGGQVDSSSEAWAKLGCHAEWLGLQKTTDGLAQVVQLPLVHVHRYQRQHPCKAIWHELGVRCNDVHGTPQVPYTPNTLPAASEGGLQSAPAHAPHERPEVCFSMLIHTSGSSSLLHSLPSQHPHLNCHAWAQADLTMEVLDSGNVNAFCGWFDVIFAGSPENPTDFEVPLSTAPDPRGSTHWGQQLFSLHPAISCSRGEFSVGLSGADYQA